MHYCPHCGAVNEEQDGRCFACARSLTGPLEEEQETLFQGRYQIQTQIGSGGYGAVYRALDRQEHGRVVAIKSINLKGLQPNQVIEATDGFNRERQLLSQLSNKHLPRVYDHFTDPYHWYLVIQYIEGSTLEEYLRNRRDSASHITRTLPLNKVLALALQLCEILHYLHTRTPPIIYRDLKPSNIMLTPQGRLYLIDFGIARHYKAGQSKDTIPLGSPGYAAPEQYGKAQTTPQADIYSLGALLHQVLSGDDPSETPFSFAPLRAYGEEGFAKLADLIMQMVNLDTSQRPANIEIIKQRLQDIMHQRKKTAPAPIKSTQTRQATTTRFAPALPGSSAYYAPGQTQQQSPSPQPQKKRRLTRRKLITASVTGFALATTLSGIVTYTNLTHDEDKARGLHGMAPKPPRRLPTLTSTRIRTPNKQELIIGLDTSDLPGYKTIHFASADETGLISFWDENHKSVSQITVGQPIRSLNWNPYASAYLLAATDHDVYRISIKELADGKNTWPFDYWHVNLVGQSDTPIAQAFYYNYQYDITVVDQTGGTTYYRPDTTAWLRWTQTKHSPGPNLPDKTGRGNNNTITVDPTGNRMTIYNGTNKIAFGNSVTQAFTQPLSPTEEAITALAWGQYSSQIAIGTDTGRILLWDPFNPSESVILPYNNETRTPIQALSWYSPDNEQVYLLITTNAGVSVWDYQAHMLNYTIPNTYPTRESIKTVAAAQLSPSATGVHTGTRTEYALITGENFVEFWR